MYRSTAWTPRKVRCRPGSLKELFEGRDADSTESRSIASHMLRTGDLTSKADDLFRFVTCANFGIRREFYELAGGFDESFTQWGGEDTEFGYRALHAGRPAGTAAGCLRLAPGSLAGNAVIRRRCAAMVLQQAKLSHLIAHPSRRTGTAGRIFTVPQYVVTIEGGDLPAERLLEAVERVLADPVHDLVVRLALPAGHAGRAWLERHLDPDPRVRVAPSAFRAR